MVSSQSLVPQVNGSCRTIAADPLQVGGVRYQSFATVWHNRAALYIFSGPKEHVYIGANYFAHFGMNILRNVYSKHIVYIIYHYHWFPFYQVCTNLASKTRNFDTVVHRMWLRKNFDE